jgi:hypothetical protein
LGQQQLLLIVLGVIIVGVAIAVSLQLMEAGSVTANRDSMVNDINNIAADAQKYFIKPVVMGGGGGSFDGYELPKLVSQTGNGIYDTNANGSEIEIVGASIIHSGIEVTLKLTLSNDDWNYTWEWKHDGL